MFLRPCFVYYLKTFKFRIICLKIQTFVTQTSIKIQLVNKNYNVRYHKNSKMFNLTIKIQHFNRFKSFLCAITK